MNYDLEPYIVGDTWKGIGTLTFVRNGSAIDLTGASAVLEFKKAYEVATPVVLSLTTANSGIVITAPTSGILAIPARVLNIPVGMYCWYVTITLASSEVQTYMTGTLPVVPKIPFYLNQNVYDHYQIIE